MSTKRSRIGGAEMGSCSLKKKRREEITALTLPEELLLHIFLKLSHKDRKSARAVCKYWHMVSYDFSLVRRDITVLHKNSSLTQNPSPSSQHVNLQIVMDFIDTKSSNALVNNKSFWQNHCHNLRYLHLITDGNDFMLISKVFPLLPLLERLDLVIENDSSHELDYSKSFFNRFQLLNLQHVRIQGNGNLFHAMADIFAKNKKLKTLEVDDLEDVLFSWHLNP